MAAKNPHVSDRERGLPEDDAGSATAWISPAKYAVKGFKKVAEKVGGWGEWEGALPGKALMGFTVVGIALAVVEYADSALQELKRIMNAGRDAAYTEGLAAALTYSAYGMDVTTLKSASQNHEARAAFARGVAEGRRLANLKNWPITPEEHFAAIYMQGTPVKFERKGSPGSDQSARMRWRNILEASAK
jgi:hypothetical protein